MDQGALSQEDGKDTLNARISSTGTHPKPGCNPLPRLSLWPSGGLRFLPLQYLNLAGRLH